MSIPRHYPEAVQNILTQLLRELEPARANLHSLVVYGSLARGEYRAGESDIDLAIVLESSSPAALAAVRGPLFKVAQSERLQPLLVGRKELPRLADVFPILMDNIKQRHDVILGQADPFAEVVVERADLRLQVEYELRNHLLRLRRYYLFTGDNVQQLGRAIVASTHSLAFELGALLEVVGKRPGDNRRDATFAAAAECFELAHGVLSRMSTFKPSIEPKVDDPRVVSELFFDVLRLVEAAVDAVDQLDTKVWGTTSPGE